MRIETQLSGLLFTRLGVSAGFGASRTQGTFGSRAEVELTGRRGAPRFPHRFGPFCAFKTRIRTRLAFKCLPLPGASVPCCKEEGRRLEPRKVTGN